MRQLELSEILISVYCTILPVYSCKPLEALINQMINQSLCLQLHFLPAVDGKMFNLTQAPEYQLRQALFQTYDHMVRPVLGPSQVMNISFQLEFEALIDVVSIYMEEEPMG